MNKKIYLIGIGWIWVSAIARYYLSKWWDVSGSDKTNSVLIESLESEGCDIIIGEDAERITPDINLVVYTEAIPKTQSELMRVWELWIKSLPYNKALWEIANGNKLIAIAGTHGKSTTTSLTSIMLKDSDLNFSAVVGTILTEFGGKNFYHRDTGSWDHHFAIEACEYKRHFLEYKPFIGIITNIELDHLDYYSWEDDYLDAFKSFAENILPGGYLILNSDDVNCKKLLWLRDDITYIEVAQEWYTDNWETISFPDISMQIPGEHILFDAKLVFVAGKVLWLSEESIISSLWNYRWVWRRMEIIWTTENANTIMSDYGHHPTEIEVTTKALQQWHPDKKLFVVFQPHQYSRTLELLDGFKNCFSHCDTVIIPNIYESRDSEEDKAKIDTQKLVDMIHHDDIHNGNGFENTLEIIQDYDKKNPASSIILLLWAGNVDDLRFKLI